MHLKWCTHCHCTIIWNVFEKCISKGRVILTHLRLLKPQVKRQVKNSRLLIIGMIEDMRSKIASTNHNLHEIYIYISFHYKEGCQKSINISNWRVMDMTIRNECVWGVNSLWPSDAIRRHRIWSALVQVMACCLTAPSHYLKQYWVVISEVLLLSRDGNFTGSPQDSSLWFFDMSLEITDLR